MTFNKTDYTCRCCGIRMSLIKLHLEIEGRKLEVTGLNYPPDKEDGKDGDN